MRKGLFFEILSGAVAASVFLLFFLVLNVGILGSLGLGLLGFVGVLFIAPKKEKKLELVASGITRQDLKGIIYVGKKKVERIKALGEQINRPTVQADVKSICQTADAIFDDFIDDPSDVKIAKKFLNYYLDTTERVLERYVSIKNKNLEDKNINETLEKAERILGTLDETFKKQMKKLIENDVMDLDVELSVLEKTIKSEGM